MAFWHDQLLPLKSLYDIFFGLAGIGHKSHKWNRDNNLQRLELSHKLLCDTEFGEMGVIAQVAFWHKICKDDAYNFVTHNMPFACRKGNFAQIAIFFYFYFWHTECRNGRPRTSCCLAHCFGSAFVGLGHFLQITIWHTSLKNGRALSQVYRGNISIRFEELGWRAIHIKTGDFSQFTFFLLQKGELRTNCFLGICANHFFCM